MHNKNTKTFIFPYLLSKQWILIIHIKTRFKKMTKTFETRGRQYILVSQKKDGTACGPDSVYVYQAFTLEVNGYPCTDESMFL